jgi:hypothetical protein
VASTRLYDEHGAPINGMMRTVTRLGVIALVVLVGGFTAACGSSVAKPSARSADSAPTPSTSTSTLAPSTTTTLSATTTAPPLTTPRPARSPVLGRAWAPEQQGYGSAGPATIDNGGDPTGLVSGVHWSSWGAAQAIATGTTTYVGPNQVVADGTQQLATVVAFDLGTCAGVPAYNAVEWFFPQHGQKFDPKNYTDACTGQYVGTP